LAYAHAIGAQARGAVMFGDEMIDEASHKMAQAIVGQGPRVRPRPGRADRRPLIS
jgi:hypothetical protein